MFPSFDILVFLGWFVRALGLFAIGAPIVYLNKEPHNRFAGQFAFQAVPGLGYAIEDMEGFAAFHRETHNLGRSAVGGEIVATSRNPPSWQGREGLEIGA